MLRISDRLDQTLRTTVCVIGSGPAGATIARMLGQSGVDVTMLESGDVEETESGQSQLVIESTGRDYPVSKSRRRSLGGTSSSWNQGIGLRVRPLEEADFRPRGDLPGWPVSYQDMCPYYDQACKLIDLVPYSQIDIENDYPSSHHVQFGGNSFQHAVFQRAHPIEARRWLQETRNVPNVNVLLNTTVVDLQLNANVVSRAVAIQDGQRIGVEAHHFVLACGGIENARLLLTSNRQIPQGIGNENDLVGRYFMEHPHVTSGFMTLRTPEAASRMSFFHPHTFENVGREGLIVPAAETCDRLSIPNAAIWFHPQSTRALAKRFVHRQTNSLGKILTDPRRVLLQARGDLWAVADIPYQRILRKQNANRQFEMQFEIEQTPLSDSRITLSNQTDEFGIPRARLDWRVADSDWQSIRTLQDLLDKELRQKRIGFIENKLGEEYPEQLPQVGNHHMGTTRMHGDPTQGVVDADCRVHGLANLYVSGSSVFTRGGAANPTLSIIAFSCRLASHLLKQCKRFPATAVHAEQ